MFLPIEDSVINLILPAYFFMISISNLSCNKCKSTRIHSNNRFTYSSHFSFFITLSKNITYFIISFYNITRMFYFVLVLTISDLMTKTQYFTVTKRVGNRSDITFKKRFVLNCIVKNDRN